MAGQHDYSEGAAASALRLAREERGLSIRRAACLLGVSPQALARYETGERPIPHVLLDSAPRIFAAVPSAKEQVRAAVGSTAPRSSAALRRSLPASLRPVLDELLGAGELGEHLEVVARRDDRRFVRPVIGPTTSARTRGLDRSAPVSVDGATLRAVRLGSGLPVAELAGRVGVPAATWRTWEARSLPRPRIGQAAEALSVPSSPEIRRIRRDAGWSLAELGRRVGVTLGVIHAWEAGKRPVPRGRVLVLLEALGEAKAVAAERRQTLVRRIVERVASSPGVSERQLAHEHRRRENGKWVESGDYRAALADAKRQRLIVTATVLESPTGYARSRPGLFVSDAAPAKAPAMTGTELARRREKLEATQQRFAELCRVSIPTVIHWEQYRDATVPAHAAARAAAAFQRLAEGERRSEAVRSELVCAVEVEPGIATWRLGQRVGQGKVVRRQLADLEKSRALARAPAYDSRGRRYDGWYLADRVPQPAASLSGAELRALREQAGWTRLALAKALDVTKNTIARYETGQRRCPPTRLVELRRILAEAPPLSRREERVLAELEATARDLGGATRTELGWPNRRRFIELAVELGRLRAEDVEVATRDGRTVTRLLLFASDVPAVERTPRLMLSPEELKAIRSAAGLSQAALGGLIGVRNVTVSGWETGRARVPLRRVRQLRALSAGCQLTT